MLIRGFLNGYENSEFDSGPCFTRNSMASKSWPRIERGILIPI